MAASRARWHPAYVGLGSNLEDPVQQVLLAFDRLATLPRTHLVMRSSLYRSPPMGPQDQPDYINAAAALLTQLAPLELLAALQEVEQVHGRRRDGERWGPRTLDLDLLLHGREQRTTPPLTLPHPGVAERAFVLQPLHELAPRLEVPGHGSVSRLLARVDHSSIERMAL